MVNNHSNANATSNESELLDGKLLVPEDSGLAVDYYLCPVNNPHRANAPYVAECGDIIEALNMNFNEASAFKAVWRKAAERTLGMKKAGNNAKRDAEKMLFYGKRELSVVTGKKVP